MATGQARAACQIAGLHSRRAGESHGRTRQRQFGAMSVGVGGWLAVAAGGALGALARWQVGQWALVLAPQAKWPWQTLLVNLVGCLLIGVVVGLAVRSWGPGAGLRLFLVTGLLGGFTTFSAFGMETLLLLRRGELALAAGYVAASAIGGVLAAWLGLLLAEGPAR